jgi:hypothetical protein
MPTTDPIKNLRFVKESQARKKEQIGVKEFNQIHSQEQSKYRDNLRLKQGEEEYKKKNAEYMKAYRLAKKALKQQQQPQQQDNRRPAANVLQNAFRNKMARNAVLRLKQAKANEVISQLNQEKQISNMNDLKLKLNASIMTNDILNTVFPSVINTNYPIRPVGRPRLSTEERLRREQQKQSKPKGKVGRPKKKI